MYEDVVERWLYRISRVRYISSHIEFSAPFILVTIAQAQPEFMGNSGVDVEYVIDQTLTTVVLLVDTAVDVDAQTPNRGRITASCGQGILGRRVGVINVLRKVGIDISGEIDLLLRIAALQRC